MCILTVLSSHKQPNQGLNIPDVKLHSNDQFGQIRLVFNQWRTTPGILQRNEAIVLIKIEINITFALIMKTKQWILTQY